jgi:hypothetical protein
VRVGVARYLTSVSLRDEFGADLRRFVFSWDQGGDWRSHVVRIGSPQRRALVDLIATALSGQPILAHLEELKLELVNAIDLEIRGHIELLPIKMLIPLLMLQFPAFLILLFGPLLGRLLQELNR